MAAKACHILIPLLIAGASTAEAADTAEHAVLGFAPQGQVFAFEEYGVQDGSGFPYSTIYIIDTTNDSWLPGTPIRVRIDDETAPLAAARAKARQQAGPVLSANGIDGGAVTLTASPLGEFEADPLNLRFGQPMPADPMQEVTRRYSAELDLFEAPAPGQDCETFIGGKPKGFRLTIRNLQTNVETVLHEDGQIPQSRGCAIAYRVSEVLVPAQFPAATVAVILSVFRPGFEGADRRFLAVTGPLPE